MRPDFISPITECELDLGRGVGWGGEASGSSGTLTASVKAVGSKGADLPKIYCPGSVPQFTNLPLWFACV